MSVNSKDIAAKLGPLPKSDDNARLQRESVKALHKLLAGQDDLLLREETKEDFGVDCSFELNLGGQMTNFRAQIQMKSSAHLAVTAKGYIPLQVSSSNLNHLLNGTSAIYLLWDANSDEFWYVWAKEENRRLSSENPSWSSQDSITLQFRERLTRETIDAVAQHILKQGCLQREIQDSLAKSTEGETVVFRIDADSLQITDASMATSLLLTSGTAIVASGYPQEVLELMRLVEQPILDLPRMQLTCGYAEYTIGNHWKALAHIRQAMARGQELSARDNSFLGTLKDASELHVGLIDALTYEQRMNKRAATLTGLEALEAEQDGLYRGCVRSTDLVERAELAKRLREVTGRILSSPQTPSTVKLAAKLLLLYVDGIEGNLAASQTEFAAEIRGQLFPGDVEGVVDRLRDARRRHLQWESQASEALKSAYELNHPILIFQALFISLKIRLGRLFEDSLDAIMDETTPAVAPTTRATLQRMLDAAAKLNEINGSLEGRLQLDELQADFLELQGDRDAAKALATKTYPQALAMGFGPIAEHSKRLLDDDTLLLRWERSYQLLRGEDDDFHHANQSDDELRRVASQLLRSVESPPARMEVVESHLRSFRQISRERVDWCRHMQILEDLVAAGNPKTAYSEPLSRKCRCDKFGHETEEASTNAFAVIGEFKQTFCVSCPARDPKRK